MTYNGVSTVFPLRALGQAYLGFEIVHAALYNGNQTLEPLAHGLSEYVFLLLGFEALHAHLGLIRHPAHELERANRTLPFSGLFS